MARKFIIDTDTASDDAIALLMALRSPEIDITAITVVSGNVPVEQGVRNALYTVHLCDAEVPVYVGAARPLLREAGHAFNFHGPDGMGGQYYLVPPMLKPAPGHAVPALITLLNANPGCTLVTLGPLTNIALAIRQEPGIAKMVERCVVMGGAVHTPGNVTPAAEYNIWADPEAARIVFNSGLPVELVGWELSRRAANLNDADLAHVQGFGTIYSEFALGCSRRALRSNREESGDPGLALPDPITVAIAIDPTLCTRQSKRHIEVETRSELTRGMTIIDAFNTAFTPINRPHWQQVLESPQNVTLCQEIDIPRWKGMLFDALR